MQEIPQSKGLKGNDCSGPLVEMNSFVKRINPIKNYILQHTDKMFDIQRVKRRKARNWRFDKDIKSEEETSKKVCLDLNSRNRMQGLSIIWIPKEGGLERFYSILRKKTSLKKVTLDLSECELPNDGLKSLTKCLETKFSLEYLSLDLGFCENITEAGVEYLGKGLLKLTQLRDLSINLDSYGGSSDVWLNNLRKVMQGHGLTSFSLTVQNSKNITDAELKQLEHAFSMPNSFQNISLRFGKSETKFWSSIDKIYICQQVTDEGLNYLTQGIQKLSLLRKISLNFFHCQRITDKSLSYLNQGFQKLPSLQGVSLNFSLCKEITDVGVNHLSKGLQALTSLKDISLNFGRCPKITDDGLKELGQCFQKFSFLQHMSLTFALLSPNKTRITDNGLNYLSQGLQKLTSLEYLSLQIRGFETFTDAGLNYLKQGLENLSCLKSLDLIFAHSCRMFTDIGLNHLKQILQKLPALQHLEITFSGSREITDNGLKNLHEGLQMLVSLQYLVLSFSCCFKIGDAGLDYLNQGFQKLSSLRHLFLNLHSCKEISDTGLSHFKHGFQAFTSLQNLSLGFSECVKITDKGFKNLKESLQTVASLQKLSLDFSKCQVTDLGLSSLKDIFCKSTSFSLREISLNFSSCQNITEDGLDQLGTGLLAQSYLQQITLDVKAVENIWNVRPLIKALQNLRFITSMEIKY